MEGEPVTEIVTSIKAQIEAAFEESASWASLFAQRAAGALREEYRFTFDDFGCPLWKVRKNLFAVEFPSRGRQHWLASRLNRDHSGSYLVVNLSGRTYDAAELQGPVMDVAMSGGCVPPIDVLLRLCVSMHKWLGRSPNHVLVAHGPDGDATGAGAAASLGPVVALFACYLSWAGLATHPKEGMLEVCGALGIPDKAILPSLRRYLSYFELLQRGCVQTVGMPATQLARLVLIDVGGDGVRRAVEVWQQERLSFRADLEDPEVVHDEDGGGAAPAIALRVVKAHCRGDLSVRILRAADEGPPLELELQVCFHTPFVHAGGGFVRFPARDLDIPSGGAKVAAGCAIDVFVEPAAAEDGAELDGVPETVSPAAVAAAAAAAAAGPKGLQPQFFDLAADDAEGTPLEEAPEATPEPLGGAPGSGTAATVAIRTVFAPDDVDAFFDEL